MRKISLKEADVFLQKTPKIIKEEKSDLARKIVFQQTNCKLIKSYKVKNQYWSASYTRGMLAVIISKNKVGIDIEKIVKKDKELFKLSSKIKNWKTFYRIWTGKEAIIKAFNLALKDHEQIIYQNHDKNKTVFLYKKKLIKLETIQYKDYFISICFRK